MSDEHATLVRGALARDEQSVRTLLRLLGPVIHVRVTRVVLRHRAYAADIHQKRQQIEDLTQEVLAALFESGGRLLRGWDPNRGMTLLGYVGLIAEQQATCILRSGRRNPWRDELTSDEGTMGEDASDDAPTPDSVLASRQLLSRIVDAMRAELTPKGLDLFYRLIIHEQPVDTVCAELAMTRDAVHAWRSRLGKLARKIAVELDSRARMSVATAHPNTL